MRFPGSSSSSPPDPEPQIALLSRIEVGREQNGAESVTRIWSISVFLFNPRERRPGEATRGEARRGRARGLLRREAGRSRPDQVTVSRFLLKKKKNNWAGGTTVATRGVPRERVRSFTGGRDTERERGRGGWPAPSRRLVLGAVVRKSGHPDGIKSITTMLMCYEASIRSGGGTRPTAV